MKFVFTVLSILIATLGITTSSVWAVNRVLSLDGDRDYVEVPHSASLNITDAITIEAWVKPISTPNANDFFYVVGKRTGVREPVPYSLIVGTYAETNRKAMFEFNDSSWHSAVSTYSIPLGEWSFIVGTYDGDTLKIYVNGILNGTTTYSGALDSTPDSVGIGANGSGDSFRFHGTIDEVRIWNISRTQEEIQATMNSTLTGQEEGLVGYWNFDDGTANDLSPNGNNGILYGDAQIVEATIMSNFIGLPIVSGVLPVDIAMYTDQVCWIAKDTADKVAEEIKKSVENQVKSISVVSEVALPEWVEKNTGDDELDIIILFGDFPDSIYPSGNVQPDGSLAELFLEDGNMFLNTADYIFWGGVQMRNGSEGLQNMLDSPQLFIDLINPITGWAPMKVTPLGRQYLPSLEGFLTARPFPINRLGEDWEVESSFADDGGARADSVVVHNKTDNGRIAIFYQVDNNSLPRGKVISEFILNWLPTIVKVVGPAVVLEDTVANPGDQFTTSISVHLAEELHSFSFDLTFDPSVLRAVSVKEGPFLSRDGVDATSWETPTIDNQNGVISNIHCSRTGKEGVGEKVVLASVTFEALKIGSTDLSIQNPRFLSPTGEEIKARAKQGLIDVYLNGSISGVVLDSATEEPIKGAKVELSRDNFTIGGLSTYSADDGTYTLSGAPVGDFDVTASKGGYLPETILKVYVERGKTTPDINIKLTSLRDFLPVKTN